LILAYQGLEEENLDKKLPGPPGCGLMQQASPLIIEKQEIANNPIRKIIIINDLLVSHVSTCIGHRQVTVKRNEVVSCLFCLHASVTTSPAADM